MNPNIPADLSPEAAAWLQVQMAISNARTAASHNPVIYKERILGDHAVNGTEPVYVWQIGAIAGWLAGLIVRGGGFGFLGNVVLGIVGAVVASYALPAIGLHMGSGFFDSVLSAMVGAIIVLVIIRLVKKA